VLGPFVSPRPRTRCARLADMQAWRRRQCCAACSASGRAASLLARACCPWQRCCAAAALQGQSPRCPSWQSMPSFGTPISRAASLPSLLSWRPSWRQLSWRARAQGRQRVGPAGRQRRRRPLPTLPLCGSRSSVRWRQPSCRYVCVCVPAKAWCCLACSAWLPCADSVVRTQRYAPSH
jgi:hypothetical protein